MNDETPNRDDEPRQTAEEFHHLGDGPPRFNDVETKRERLFASATWLNLDDDRLTFDAISDGIYSTDVLLTADGEAAAAVYTKDIGGVAGSGSAAIGPLAEHRALSGAVADIVQTAQRLEKLDHITRGLPDGELAILNVRFKVDIRRDKLQVTLEGRAHRVQYDEDRTGIIERVDLERVPFEYLLPKDEWSHRVTIRPIDPAADQLLVRELALEDAVRQYAGDMYDPEAIVELLLSGDTPARQNFLISWNDTFVGFAHLDHTTGSDGVIIEPCFCVALSHARGRGIGTTALRGLTEMAATRGGAVARVFVRNEELHIVKMCETVGFALAGVTEAGLVYERVLL